MEQTTTHTLVVGDTHMDWVSLVRTLRHFEPEVCIVAGDFGWWPEMWIAAKRDGRNEGTLRWLLENKPSKTEIRFIEGNHEDLDKLFAFYETYKAAPYQAVEFASKLWYQPRGSTYTLADGRSVFFCGGGKSVDVMIRKPHVSWFPQETVRRDELPEELPKSDIVISHTVPNASGVFETMRPIKEVCSWWDDTPDETCATLDAVLEKTRPKLWLASHLHLFRDIMKDGTRFIVLDRTDGNLKPWTDFTYVLI